MLFEYYGKYTENRGYLDQISDSGSLFILGIIKFKCLESLGI